MLYLLVVGSRNFGQWETMKRVLWNAIDKFNEKDVMIVSGGARGADSLAEKFADEFHFQKKIFPADWDRFGKAAGFIRNKKMHQFIKEQSEINNDPRLVVAFWDGQSRGTAQNFQLADQFENHILIYRYLNRG